MLPFRRGAGYTVPMSNRHSAGSRDHNEPEILAVIRQYGIDYLLMPEGMGFDVLLFLSPLHCVEIKNPERPPSARKLTPVEQARKDVCDGLGIPYRVIETPEEMAELIRHWW